MSRFDPLFKPFFVLYVTVSVVLLLLGLGPALAKAIPAVQDIRQLFTRPTLRWSPYSTPARGVYICSASPPPGGGVHGMCGYHAARACLRRDL